MNTHASEDWFVWITTPNSAVVNMATDEALLEAMPSLQSPVLRLYSWSEPAATFGYFQRYADVEAWTALRPLVRRPTGGGIVPHDCDWTYSLAFPAGHRWHQLRAIQSYRAVHQWLCDSFSELGIETVLAPAPNKSLPGQCFAGYEEADLLLGQSKIAGAAQRRNRLGLLIQGSVHPPASVARENWQQAACAVMERQGISWKPLVPGLELQTAIERLAVKKYATESYNRKR